MEDFYIRDYKNGVFLIEQSRKLFIIKLDDIKGMITFKYLPNFDFKFDNFSKSVLKTEDQGSYYLNLQSKKRKDGLMDYIDVFEYT